MPLSNYALSFLPFSIQGKSSLTPTSSHEESSRSRADCLPDLRMRACGVLSDPYACICTRRRAFSAALLYRRRTRCCTRPRGSCARPRYQDCWSRLPFPLIPRYFAAHKGGFRQSTRPTFLSRSRLFCLPTVLRGAKRRLIFSVRFSRELSQRRFYADIMIEIPAKLNKLFMLSLGRASRISLIVFANATFCQLLILSCYFVAVCLNTGHVRILYFSNFVLLVSNAVNICAASNLDA